MLDDRKATLLDIGYADETTASATKKIFPKLTITGLDKYGEAIKYAKNTKPSMTFIQGDAHKLPFKKTIFDYVLAIETLKHLHDPSLVLSKISRVLKKNGYLIVVQDTDNWLFKTVWWFWIKWKGSVWNHSHINCLKPEELIKKVKKAGFKIKSVECANLGMEVFIKTQNK